MAIRRTPAARAVNPIDGGTVGRVDMGVDISGHSGATLRDPVPGTSKFVGITDHNWYKGQPFALFQVLDGPFRGKYWYAAEGVNIQLSPGQTVRLGQKIGVYVDYGNATEWGWATSSGQTLAKATTGYTEGQQTPAGLDFLNRIIHAPGRAVAGGASGSGFGGTRPGGGGDSGAAIKALFQSWESEVNMPRAEPKGTQTKGGWKGPFNWWLKSFRGKYGAEQKHG